MKLTLLGTGGPRPDPDRHGPAAVVAYNGRLLLFDCGRGVVMQLTRAEIPLSEIGPVFLTHHHYDHIGDLGDVILSTWLQGRPSDLPVYGPSGIDEVVEALTGTVFARDIRVRSEGEPHIGDWKPARTQEIAAGLVWEDDGIRVTAEKVRHGQGFGIRDFDWVTLGYRIEAGGKVLAISGDTVPCPGLDRLAQGADVLLLCCYLANAEIRDDHSRRLVTHLFPTSTQAGEIAQRNGVGHLVLTHFRRKSPELMAALEGEVRAAYSGRVTLGQDLKTVSV